MFTIHVTGEVLADFAKYGVFTERSKAEEIMKALTPHNWTDGQGRWVRQRHTMLTATIEPVKSYRETQTLTDLPGYC